MKLRWSSSDFLLLLVFFFSYLSLCELQRGRQEKPLRPDHVLLPRELLLQPGQLLTGEASAHAFRFPTFRFEGVKPCADFGQRSCEEERKRETFRFQFLTFKDLFVSFSCWILKLTLCVKCSTTRCLVGERWAAVDGVSRLSVCVQHARCVKVRCCGYR